MESDQTQTRRLSGGMSLGTSLALHSFRLVCTAGPDKGRDWLVEHTRARIGSASASEIRLSDPSVSRAHAIIQQTPKGWVIEDQDSKNGVLLDGVPVATGYLRLNSRLRLGETELTFTPRETLLLARPSSAGEYGKIIGSSPKMNQVFGVLEKVAPLTVSIMIRGPTGTGKTELARQIHARSPRRERPFVVLDCANLDGDLVRAELFGHEKGAFTGADQARKGVFEAAEGGTVFIDEIGELPLDLQPRLLRVLEEREVCRLGSQVPIPVDVRLIAATHRDLRKMVSEGRFREDLLYRLCVIEVEMPPLKDRPEDIERIAEGFLRLWKADHLMPIPAEVAQALRAHPWPGNVRELRNALERATALAGVGPLTPDLLGLRTDLTTAPGLIPGAGPDEAADDRPERDLDAAEKEIVMKALAKAGGNKTQAAKDLGIAITTLRRKIEKYGLE